MSEPNKSCKRIRKGRAKASKLLGQSILHLCSPVETNATAAQLSAEAVFACAMAQAWKEICDELSKPEQP